MFDKSVPRPNPQGLHPWLGNVAPAGLGTRPPRPGMVLNSVEKGGIWVGRLAPRRWPGSVLGEARMDVNGRQWTSMDDGRMEAVYRAREATPGSMPSIVHVVH